MFIKVTTNENNLIDLNTTNISYIDDHHCMMNNGFTIFLTDDSLKEVQEAVYGSTEAVNPRIAEKTAQLLTELHKLCGGKGEAKPTSDRKARLKTRMKDFNEEELKTAAKHLGENAFMQGENDSNKRYGTLDYLLRTSANVNKWLDDDSASPKKKPMF